MSAILKKEVIGGQTLILGDCLKVMPELGRFDAVVTDPPYGIGAGNYARGGTQYGNSKAKCKEYSVKNWDAEAPQEAVDFARKIAGKSIIFGGNYFDLPPSKCWLVWDKQNGEGSGYADCELAWTNLDKAVRRVYWRWAGMLQKHMGDKKEVRVHPTQKPVGVMEWCIGHLPGGAQTILDPFMGSGTTLVACQRLGRSGVGIELDQEYFVYACERVHEAWRSPDLFIETPAPPQPEQIDLLDQGDAA